MYLSPSVSLFTHSQLIRELLTGVLYRPPVMSNSTPSVIMTISRFSHNSLFLKQLLMINLTCDQLTNSDECRLRVAHNLQGLALALVSNLPLMYRRRHCPSRRGV